MTKIPKHSLKGKVAVVTGAGSGLGAAAAIALAEAGARVAVLGHNTDDELGKIARRVQKIGGHESLVLEADVADAAQMKASFERLRKSWKRLDIVHANAGINGAWCPLEELSPSEWDKTLNVNLRGTYLTVYCALPLMKKRGGSIVVTSSVNGTRMFSNTGASAYATSKAGQLAFVRMVAPELAKFKIRINTICPGAIESEIDDNTRREGLETIRLPIVFPKGQIPLTGRKPGKAEQVGRLVWFLASDFSDHITGAEVFIDGGQSLIQG